MPKDQNLDLGSLVEPDRVHKACYADEEIFEQELKNIFHKSWIYIGHESQVPNPGDYWTTRVGKERMIICRAEDGQVHVLYNRCPHRGALICNNLHGNSGNKKSFRCPYHAWQFAMDGSLRNLPMKEGYDGIIDLKDPQLQMKPAERQGNYRGFIFASLSEDGPDLETWLGGGKVAFDDICNRSPEGEAEIVANCFRIVQHSNWKIFLENQLDAVHPSITHHSTGDAAADMQKVYKKKTGEDAPMGYQFLADFTLPFEKWDSLDTIGHPNGHTVLEGYMGLRPTDAVTQAHEKVLTDAYGEDRMNEILDTKVHHVLVYPCLSVQPPLQQLRAVRPLAANKTLTEIWHFRLKGAPEGIYDRSLAYYYHVNAPSTMVNADDLNNFRACQDGLRLEGGGDWVSLHRNVGQDPVKDGVTTSVTGMSEQPMRNMFAAWKKYMTNEGSA
ncbi:MAG: Rieske 2Fe-2S domain-containing protein [Rhodospirillaceae bacterium]|nr:Rieske 2Fe-2S domain-containing protein [Rhodospirillaceae bacterium]